MKKERPLRCFINKGRNVYKFSLFNSKWIYLRSIENVDGTISLGMNITEPVAKNILHTSTESRSQRHWECDNERQV